MSPPKPWRQLRERLLLHVQLCQKWSNGVVGTASGLAKTVIAKYEPAAKDLYTKYEPVAEQYAATAWRSLNQLPFSHRLPRPLPQRQPSVLRSTTRACSMQLGKATGLHPIFRWCPLNGSLRCSPHRKLKRAIGGGSYFIALVTELWCVVCVSCFCWIG